MGRILCGLLLVAVASTTVAEHFTTAEASGFTRTSSYAEVVDFIRQAAAGSSLVTLATMGRTAEGRDIPLVILSRERIRTPAELRSSGKGAVLIMANIHGGEVEGKEACQMLVRETAAGRLAGLLDTQVVLVVPIINADGNERLGPNRRDNGPELAGVRHNGQYLDLNRDFVKLESPEVRALVRLLREWDPVLVVDMHTTNGSHHRDPVTFSTGAHPASARLLTEYMWERLLPAVSRRLRDEYGWGSLPYGTFVAPEFPERGWENDAFEMRYGTNYITLRNRLAILDENYAYADFRTRVLASLDFVRSILEYTASHMTDLIHLTRRADAETRATFRSGPFPIAWRLSPFMDVTVRGFEHERVPTTEAQRLRFPWWGEYRMVPTAVEREYTVPYLAKALPTREVALPAGYVLLPGFDDAAAVLAAHGIAVERLLQPAVMIVQRYSLTGVQVADRLVQGNAPITLTGEYTDTLHELPAGTLYVDLHQPLARLIPVLLEPESNDSLAVWGFFNRSLVRQWSAEPGLYPVLRLPARPTVPMEVARESAASADNLP